MDLIDLNKTIMQMTLTIITVMILLFNLNRLLNEKEPSKFSYILITLSWVWILVNVGILFIGICLIG